MNKQLIKRWLDYMEIGNYTINDDDTVDVDYDVILYNIGLIEIPVVFRTVWGDFNCGYNKLTSLKGSPREVGGDFICYHNNLTSLKGSTIEVGGDFYANDNNLTSLQGAPKEVGGNFVCSNNKLTSLQGSLREVGGHFDVDNNKFTIFDVIDFETHPDHSMINIGGQIYWSR